VWGWARVRSGSPTLTPPITTLAGANSLLGASAFSFGWRERQPLCPTPPQPFSLPGSVGGGWVWEPVLKQPDLPTSGPKEAKAKGRTEVRRMGSSPPPFYNQLLGGGRAVERNAVKVVDTAPGKLPPGDCQGVGRKLSRGPCPAETVTLEGSCQGVLSRRNCHPRGCQGSCPIDVVIPEVFRVRVWSKF